ncbi:MAG: DUF1194 domain-containing protein [Rhizobiaceae bacterium]|nr:DUF1194 domain-containing protein [Rhizobiaceae bacterium]
MKAKLTALFWSIAFLTIIATLIVSQKTQSSRAGTGVDMLLVISLDVSASVDANEYELMRAGLAKTFLSPDVAQAISAGSHGAIAIAVIQWSGFQEQEIKVDWLRLANALDLAQLAARISRMTRRYKGGATDIGGALEFSSELISSAPFSASRNVIDIVGDGPNNVNYSPERTRDKVLERGIIINALAVTGSYELLNTYFADLVIGGQNAFVESAADYDGFERAIHRKLLREIGNLNLF